jgi:hypothetical protein
MLRRGNISDVMSERLGAIHTLVRQLGLVNEIDQHLHLLRLVLSHKRALTKRRYSLRVYSLLPRDTESVEPCG